MASPDPPQHNGVTVYEMFDEAELGNSAYAPLVEKAQRMSPGLTKASTWRAKTLS